MTSSSPPETGLLSHLRPVLTRWWLVLGISAIAGALAYYHSSRQPETYTAGTSVFIQSSPVSNAVGLPSSSVEPNRLARNEATLLMSREVARQVAKDIGFRGDPRQLLGNIAATPVPDADFLEITAVAGEPAQAAELANGFARAYLKVRGNDFREEVGGAIRSLKLRLATLPPTLANRQQRAGLQGRISNLQVLQLLPTDSGRQLDPAEPPLQANGTNPIRDGVFGALVGLVLGIGAAFVLEALRRKIKWSDDIEPLYHRPLLVQLPHVRRPNIVVDGRSAMAESLSERFRLLRTKLQLARRDGEGSSGDPMRSLLVTSATSGEGKSTVVRNLAIAFLEDGARVAVVDADLRCPSMSTLFRMPDAPGLVEVITGKMSLENALQHVEVHVDDSEILSLLTNGNGAHPEPVTHDGLRQVPLSAPNGADRSREMYERLFDRGRELYARLVSTPPEIAAASTNGHARTPGISLLSAGALPGNPATLLGSKKLGEVLAQLATTHDVVIVDSSPLLPVGDTLQLLSVVDGVLLVARLGTTTRAAALQLSETIERTPGTSVVGIVANDVRASEGLQRFEDPKYASRTWSYRGA